MEMPALSVVVPVLDEEGSLEALLAELVTALAATHRPYEILFIDDGSRDGSPRILADLAERDSHVRVVRFRKNYGKSAALSTGFHLARGQIIITLDGDGQDDPGEIPQFLAKLDQGYDLVSGWKVRRRDPLKKRLPSRLFNTVTAWTTGIPLHDFNCGFKAYRRQVAKEVPLYGELHRYIPVLASWDGFRIAELEVNHRPRTHGRSKYGGGRFVRGCLDLVTVLFHTQYARRPLHLFGGVGLLFFAAGFGVGLQLVWDWLHKGIGWRPLLFLDVVLLLAGIQFISMGLLGEMLTRAYFSRKEYGIRDLLGFDERDGHSG